MRKSADRPMAAIQILKDARELLGDPARWTQHDYARSAAGEYVASVDEAAVCWCALGAINRAFGPIAGRDRAPHTKARMLLEEACGGSIVEFNDTHDHAAVLAAFDRAIKRAEAQ